jgi:hypothetical protein
LPVFIFGQEVKRGAVVPNVKLAGRLPLGYIVNDPPHFTRARAETIFRCL